MRARLAFPLVTKRRGLCKPLSAKSFPVEVKSLLIRAWFDLPGLRCNKAHPSAQAVIQHNNTASSLSFLRAVPYGDLATLSANEP